MQSPDTGQQYRSTDTAPMVAFPIPPWFPRAAGGIVLAVVMFLLGIGYSALKDFWTMRAEVGVGTVALSDKIDRLAAELAEARQEQRQVDDALEILKQSHAVMASMLGEGGRFTTEDGETLRTELVRMWEQHGALHQSFDEEYRRTRDTLLRIEARVDALLDRLDRLSPAKASP